MATEAAWFGCKVSTGKKEKTKREKPPYRREKENHS
jgi:hypothetical protein